MTRGSAPRPSSWLLWASGLMLFAAGCAAILNWRQQARQPRFSVGPGNRGDGFEQGLLLVPPRGADETPDFALAQNEIIVIDEP
jgi:hypothetical protein